MNHCFATSQRVLTGDLFDEALREINQRRFAGVYQIVREGDNWWVEPDAGWPYGFHCWFRSKRKVTFRRDPGEWATWVTIVFQEEIAAKFKGRCSDEGVQDIWQPEPNKYPTFKSYWEAVNLDWGCKPIPKVQRFFLKGVWKRTAAKIPKELQRFVT